MIALVPPGSSYGVGRHGHGPPAGAGAGGPAGGVAATVTGMTNRELGH
jgi:hypothetical protein